MLLFILEIIRDITIYVIIFGEIVNGAKYFIKLFTTVGNF